MTAILLSNYNDRFNHVQERLNEIYARARDATCHRVKNGDCHHRQQTDAIFTQIPNDFHRQCFIGIRIDNIHADIIKYVVFTGFYMFSF